MVSSCFYSLFACLFLEGFFPIINKTVRNISVQFFVSIQISFLRLGHMVHVCFVF